MKFWEGAYSYIQGRGHVKKDVPCQDRAYFFQKNGITLLSLADGAGSCIFSQEGAEISVKETGYIFSLYFDMFYNLPDEEAGEKILTHILLKLKERAKELNTDLKQLSSTLMFVALRKDRYIAGHLGDGVSGYMMKDELKVLSHPDNSEYANTTYFTTSSKAAKNFRVVKGLIGDITGFVLMSDGTAFSLYNKKEKKLVPVTGKIIDWLGENSVNKVTDALEKNLRDSICKKTDDDCSIAIMKLVDKKTEIFGNGRKVNMKNRKKILTFLDGKDSSEYRDSSKSIITNLEKLANKKLSQQTGLSRNSLRKHIKYMYRKGMIDF